MCNNFKCNINSNKHRYTIRPVRLICHFKDIINEKKKNYTASRGKQKYD